MFLLCLLSVVGVRWWLCVVVCRLYVGGLLCVVGVCGSSVVFLCAVCCLLVLNVVVVRFVFLVRFLSCCPVGVCCLLWCVV